MLTSYHSTLPHLYGLLQTHKPDVPLVSTVSCTGTACYALDGFLHQMLYALVGNTETWVKCVHHFSQLLKSVKVQRLNVPGDLDVVKFFTNIPVQEVLEIFKKTPAGR
jgi:hypothetical protein